MTFSTVGSPQTWDLSEQQIAEWQELYPRIDVREECMKALAWTRANNRKTARGMPRFLVAWLSRASDRRSGPVDRRQYPTHDRREPWRCPHLEQCPHRGQCDMKLVLGTERYPVKESA